MLDILKYKNSLTLLFTCSSEAISLAHNHTESPSWVRESLSPKAFVKIKKVCVPPVLVARAERGVTQSYLLIVFCGPCFVCAVGDLLHGSRDLTAVIIFIFRLENWPGKIKDFRNLLNGAVCVFPNSTPAFNLLYSIFKQIICHLFKLV